MSTLPWQHAGSQNSRLGGIEEQLAMASAYAPNNQEMRKSTFCSREVTPFLGLRHDR
jgi:hypothetical protein